MMLPRVLLAIVACTVMLPSLALSQENGQALVEVIMLSFEEQEAGTEVYPVRMLISDAAMRFDDGHNDGDFVLMNRKSRSLFSVNHEEQTILVVEYRAAGIELPPPPELTVTEQVDDAAPRIMGRKTVSRDYHADGELCLQVIAVPGLLEVAVDAMSEYAGVLAERENDVLRERQPPDREARGEPLEFRRMDAVAEGAGFIAQERQHDSSSPAGSPARKARSCCSARAVPAP